TCTPWDGAAASIERMKNLDCGDVSGLNMTPTRARSGAISFSSSSHFPPTENSNMLKPVRLPPGRVTLVTKPCSTGSETCTNTIGTVLVACWRAVRLAVEAATIRASDRSAAQHKYEQVRHRQRSSGYRCAHFGPRAIPIGG